MGKSIVSKLERSGNLPTKIQTFIERIVRWYLEEGIAALGSSEEAGIRHGTHLATIIHLRSLGLLSDLRDHAKSLKTLGSKTAFSLDSLLFRLLGGETFSPNAILLSLLDSKALGFDSFQLSLLCLDTGLFLVRCPLFRQALHLHLRDLKTLPKRDDRRLCFHLGIVLINIVLDQKGVFSLKGIVFILMYTYWNDIIKNLHGLLRHELVHLNREHICWEGR